MSNVRVKVSVEHMRDQITQYIEAEASERAEVIATAVRDAVDAFDFDAAVAAVCRAELDKFVRDAVGTCFRTLMSSKETHARVVESLRTQMEGIQ